MINGYEGIYSVTEDGKVWSYRNNCFLQPKIYGKMKSFGYRLYKNSIGSVISINTLLRVYFPKENPEFKYIRGYEGLYGVAIDGRVFSYTNNKIIKGRKSKTSPYLYVSLYKNSKETKYSIHRLVALTYISNPYKLPEVDHIDRDIYNNNMANLRWVTRKGNLLNTEIQFARNVVSCDLYKNKLFIRRFRSIESASQYANDKFGVSISSIRRYLHSGGCEIKVERLA